MRKSTMHVLLTASILIFSSLAGCLGTTDEEDEASKGTVIVSTYHVEQIVSAIAGDTLNVEILAPSNVPVHDYEPSAADLVRLQSADMFFYHGLGLETWIDATMDSLGDDAPPSFSTHTMPTGEISLDYETMLVDKLCDSLSNPTADDGFHMLAEHAEDADELHGDDGAHNLGFPEDDHDDHDDHGDEDHDDHDDHGDEDHDDHDDHGDEDHDDHDDHGDHDEHDHGDHEMLMPEDSLEASTNCPTGTVISVYHFEAGEYMLEFEGEDVETFMMAIAAMGGAHHHHHGHGDDDHGDDDHGDDDHGDDDHDGHDDHGDDDHDGHDDHGDHDDDMTPEEAMQQADTNNDSKISWEEFEAVWEMDDDHDHEEHEEGCHDTSTHETHDEYTNEADCEAAGHMWMEDHDEEGCHDTTTHETHDEYTNETDCEAAGHMWMEDHDEDDHDPLEEAMEEYLMGMFMEAFNESDEDGDSLLDIDELGHFIEAMDAMEDMDLPGEVMLIAFDEDGDDLLSFDEFMHSLGMDEDDHDHDHDNHTGDGQDNETHDENEAMEEMFTEMFHMMFNMSDADGDGYLNASEIESMMDMLMEEDHEEGVAFIGLHIEEEGEYGIALPAGVELHVLMAGGHEGHDHGAHDDHDDHGDEDTHDDHGDEEGHDDHGDEEALAYDPHSWLDPLAYKAQVALVLGEMKTTFPDLADTFQTNADAFMVSLDEVDASYTAAFGPNGTCTNNTVAANHNAYSYIAYRYNLEFVTVHGLDPEGEPSAADIAEVVEKIEEDAITVLFIEEYTDETAVNSIVDQTNGAVTVQTLYTMELPPKDSSDDYLSLMEKNLNSLKAGLGC